MSQDPLFSKYFKLLRLGAPVAQLKMRMQAEGVDPNVLDLDPMAPSPSGALAPPSGALRAAPPRPRPRARSPRAAADVGESADAESGSESGGGPVDD